MGREGGRVWKIMIFFLIRIKKNSFAIEFLTQADDGDYNVIASFDEKCYKNWFQYIFN